jgi:hypothetical protein
VNFSSKLFENIKAISCRWPLSWRGRAAGDVTVDDQELTRARCHTDVVRSAQPPLVDTIWITSRSLLPVLEMWKRSFVAGTQREDKEASFSQGKCCSH